jgi:hypothetical protein
MNSLIEQVNNVCQQVRLATKGSTTFKKLINRVRKEFKDHGLDLTVRTKKDKDLEPDRWYVMAYYDNENDLDGDTPIEVIIHHNLIGDEEFGLHHITNFLIEIYDATVHEFRHQHQSKLRNYKDYVDPVESPYKAYLESQDELDAYAFSIAIELLRFMSKERASRYMSKISIMSKMRKGSQYVSPTLCAYFGIFGLSPVTKNLAKKVYKHLQTVDTRYVFM